MRASHLFRPVRRSAAVLGVAVAVALPLTGCITEERPAPGDDVGPVPPTSAAPPTTTGGPGAGATSSATSPAPGSAGPGSPAPTGAPTGPAPTSSPPAPTAAAVGGVVEGFPLDVVPVLPQAEVTLSDVVAQDGGGRTVALAGRTSRSPDEVVAFYTEALTGHGFTATTPPGIEGAVVITFTRGEGAADLLTLSVASSGGLQDFSIGGRLA